MKSVTFVYHEGPGYSHEAERSVLLPRDADIHSVLQDIEALGLTPLRPKKGCRYLPTDRYQTEGEIEDGSAYSVFTGSIERTAKKIMQL